MLSLRRSCLSGFSQLQHLLPGTAHIHTAAASPVMGLHSLLLRSALPSSRLQSLKSSVLFPSPAHLQHQFHSSSKPPFISHALPCGASSWDRKSRPGPSRSARRRTPMDPQVTVAPSLAVVAAAVAESGAGGPVIPEGSFQAAVGKFVLDQFLPLGLLTGMIAGYCFPAGGVLAANAGLQGLTTMGIFVISGLGLKRGEALAALSSWGSTLYGFVGVLAITPLAALVAMRLPLAPPEFAFGLAVFCCMPTTLSSGVSLTQAVGGNTALALLLTVGTNLAGIFTMPFVLSAILGTGASAIHIDPAPLLRALIETILVPLLAGMAARAFIPGLAAVVDKRKKALGLLSACLLAMVPWMQISRAVTTAAPVAVASLAVVVAAGIAIHLAYLAFNLTAVKVLRLGGPPGPQATAIQRALVLVTSQKTLPIAVTVLTQLSVVLGGSVGLAVIPCVCAHLFQILIDSFLVSHWLEKDRKQALEPPPATIPLAA